MTLTKPDFRLDRPNPNPSLITDATWWYWLRLQELEPTTKLGGIFADKSGFHNTAQANLKRWPSNYSVRNAADRRGPGLTKARALDWTFPDAQGGNFARIDKYTSRLVTSAHDPADPRLDLILVEFYGQADSDREVEGYNEREERAVSSDPSHLWHQHKSFIGEKVGDFWGFWALLTVDMGWDVARWRSTIPGSVTPPPKPVPPKPSGLPVHKLGSRVLEDKSPDMRGTDIQIYQRFIGKLTADGIFGGATKRRTMEYQRMRGLKPDGIAGPKTLGPIVKALKL